MIFTCCLALLALETLGLLALTALGLMALTALGVGLSILDLGTDLVPLTVHIFGSCNISDAYGTMLLS